MLGVGCHKRRALVDRSYMWVIKPGSGKTNRCEGMGEGEQTKRSNGVGESIGMAVTW